MQRPANAGELILRAPHPELNVSRFCFYVCVLAVNFLLKRKRQLSQIPVRRVGAPLQRDEELLRRIAGATLALKKQQVLPLKESGQPDVKADRLDGDVYARIGTPRCGTNHSEHG